MEVLRVLAMFLIVAGHYVWTAVKQVMEPSVLCVNKSLIGGGNYVTMEFLWLIASIGVDCFVMITGYFMIEKKEMRWRGVLKTWVQTLFYTAGIFLMGVAAFDEPLSLDLVLKSFLPIHHETYWFVSHYIALLFLAPFFARVASGLTQRQYLWLLSVLFVFCFTLLYGTVFLRNMHLGLFVFLFFVAGYLRKYGVPEWWKRHTGRMVLGVWVLLFVAATSVNLLHYWQTGDANFKLYATENNGPVFFLALAVFVWFVCHKPFTGSVMRWTARLGGCTFGVYLIHQHFFINDTLWTFVANTYTMQMPMLVHCLLWSAAIFAVCALIDTLRAHLFRLLHIDNALDKLAGRLPRL